MDFGLHMLASRGVPAARNEMASELQKAVGKRVSEHRRARGLTQSALADRAGVDTTYVTRLEAGAINATLAKLEAFAKALDVKPTELLSSVDGAQLPKRLERLVALTGQLSPGDVKLLTSFAERLTRAGLRR